MTQFDRHKQDLQRQGEDWDNAENYLRDMQCPQGIWLIEREAFCEHCKAEMLKAHDYSVVSASADSFCLNCSQAWLEKLHEGVEF